MSASSIYADHVELIGAISSVWATELGVPTVGVDDDFFTLGGTSLGAARVVAALRDTWGIETSFAVLLRNSSPVRFAAAVLAGGDAAPRMLLPRLDDDAAPPVTIQQEAIWFLEQIQPDNTAYQNLVVLDLPEQVDRARLAASLGALVDRHALLRTSFPTQRGRPILRRHAEPVVHLDVVDLTAMSDGARADWIRAVARQPIPRTEPGLLRWTLADHNAGQSLILVEHHFLHDGWSLGRLITELAHVYRTGSIEGLPPLPHQYAEYAVWQRLWLETDAARSARHFWVDLLSDQMPPLRLPRDAARPNEFTFVGETLHTRLPSAVVTAARGAAREFRTTTFAVLMAAFASVAGAVCGSPDFNLGSMLRNRRVPGTENILGMFVNTIALPVRGWAQRSLRDLAGDLTDMLTAGMEHQEIPFPLIAQSLPGERDSSRNPHFQVCFSMNDYPDLQPEWVPGRCVSLRYPSNGGAKFDLDVVLIPEGDGYEVLWRYYAPVLTVHETARIAELFHDVVQAAVARPDQPLAVVVGAAGWAGAA